MYICVCSAVTDRQIEKAVAGGATCVDDVAMQLGVGACCGLCRDEAQALITKVRFVAAPASRKEAVNRDDPRV
jgi:bacterioferritin-associated ferredoxin